MTVGAMGYQLQKMVRGPGDFVGGSIIDIYALNTTDPVRIDLFDTESTRYATLTPVLSEVSRILTR
ncbi:MAG: hypothetical protein ACLSH6_09735 [Limosilactobacillus pontis]